MNLYRLSSEVTQGELPLRYLGFDMDEPVIAPGENRTEPNRCHEAEIQALPVAIDGKMGVKQRRQSHAFDLRQQQRDAVDTLGDHVGFLVPPHSLTQSAA